MTAREWFSRAKEEKFAIKEAVLEVLRKKVKR